MHRNFSQAQRYNAPCAVCGRTADVRLCSVDWVHGMTERKRGWLDQHGIQWGNDPAELYVYFPICRSCFARSPVVEAGREYTPNPPPEEDGDGGIGDTETNPHPLESGVATRVWQDDAGNIHVRYHETDVVSFNNEWITLRTDGYDTVTTRRRMNQVSDHFNLGFGVYRDRGTTWVNYGGSKFELLDPTSMSRFTPTVVDNSDVVEPTSGMPRGRRAPGWAERLQVGAPDDPEARRDEELRRAGYVTFTRRTDFPKLGYIIDRLNELNIPSVLHGDTFHADHILWVPESRHEEAWAILDDKWGDDRLDDVPDDDPSFEEYALVRPNVVDVRIERPRRSRPSRPRRQRRPVEAPLHRGGSELGFEEGEWESTEKNPPPEGTDVLVHDYGNVAVFLPLTGGSRDWWEKNVRGVRRHGSVYLVDAQDSQNLLNGMQAEGLKVFVR